MLSVGLYASVSKYSQTCMDEQNFDEEFARATQFLIDGNETDAVLVLLSCKFISYDYGNDWLDIKLQVRRPNYDILLDKTNLVTKAIHRSFYAVLPLDEWEVNKLYITPVVELSNTPLSQDGWRDELLRQAIGENVDNQGTFITGDKVKTWNGFKFASLAEVQIARAFDKVGVLFLPNCKARFRVGADGRGQCYPDFLICHEGRWGVLEVDGPHHDKPAYIRSDRSRDQSLRAYGIYVERFDYKECEQHPDSVVEKFLTLLKMNK